MKLKLLIILLLLFSLGQNSFAQRAEFSEAIGSETSEPGLFAKWNFEIGSAKYEILSSGQAKKLSGNNFAAKFRLPLGKNEIVSNRVYFTQYKRDLVLLYEANVAGEGIGYIASFSLPAMKLKWKAIVRGFNVGQGLVENQFAYLTAIGFAGKINLLTGKYIWKHDDLYNWNKNNGAFNSFEIPELEGSNVIFTEKTVYNKTNIIVVNKTTGKIIRTILEK